MSSHDPCAADFEDHPYDDEPPAWLLALLDVTDADLDEVPAVQTVPVHRHTDRRIPEGH